MDRFGSHENFRSGLVEDLRRQLLGPISQDSDEDKREVLSISPLQLYATGVLFPQRLPQDLLEDSKDREIAEGSEADDSELSNVKLDEGKSRHGSYADEGLTSIEREPLNLANEFSPSACGISFRLQQPADIIVELSYGTYAPRRALSLIRGLVKSEWTENHFRQPGIYWSIAVRTTST